MLIRTNPRKMRWNVCFRVMPCERCLNDALDHHDWIFLLSELSARSYRATNVPMDAIIHNYMILIVFIELLGFFRLDGF